MEGYGVYKILDGVSANAINKFIFWSMNYDCVNFQWIKDIWKGCETEHFQKKFDDCYKSVGADAAIIRFYLELDEANRIKLIDWVMRNYNQERKLF